MGTVSVEDRTRPTNTLYRSTRALLNPNSHYAHAQDHHRTLLLFLQSYKPSHRPQSSILISILISIWQWTPHGRQNILEISATASTMAPSLVRTNPCSRACFARRWLPTAGGDVAWVVGLGWALVRGSGRSCGRELENATRCVSLLSRLRFSFAPFSTCFSAPFQHHLSGHSSAARAAINKPFSQRSYCTRVDADRTQERQI
jgi:hypothetical protein